MRVLRFDMLSKRLSRRDATASAAMQSLELDNLYVVSGTDVKPVGAGALQVGTWRSKRFAAPYHRGFGWFKVSGSPSSGVVLRFYVDGVLRYTSPSIVDREPHRLPALSGRWWEVEIESQDRITAVSLAESSEELVE